MTQEAMKLALEALEKLNNTNSYWWQEVDEQTIKKIENSITAIKEALANHIEDNLVMVTRGGAWGKQLTSAQRNELKQIEDGTWEADRNG